MRADNSALANDVKKEMKVLFYMHLLGIVIGRSIQNRI
jgi:hypothetical protein